MKRNMAIVDRVIRIVLAAVVAVLYLRIGTRFPVFRTPSSGTARSQ